MNSNITIQILNTSKPYTINNNNNFLEYKDNNYNYIIFSYTTDYLPDTINILKSNNIKYS